MNNVFKIPEKAWERAKTSKYVMGVDATDDKVAAYCLMQYVDGKPEQVVLSKSLRNNKEFDLEVKALARYFNAPIMDTNGHITRPTPS